LDWILSGFVPAAGEELETLGKYLRKSREERGISLEKIASSTKINMSYLRSIEEDRYDLLPAEVFTVGFLKQYAQLVGLDSEDVILRYRLAMQKARTDLADGPPDKSPGNRKQAFVMLCGLLFVLGILWVVFAPGDARKEERIRAIRIPKSSPREIKRAQLWKDLELDAAGSQHPAPEGVTSAQTDPKGEGALLPESEGEPVEILVQAIRKTWVQVEMDDGAPVERSLKPGEQCAFKANAKIQLRIGSGNGVRIVYKGKIFEDLGKKDDIIEISFPPPDSG
jgi:cytoskeletal protein RodZ